MNDDLLKKQFDLELYFSRWALQQKSYSATLDWLWGAWQRAQQLGWEQHARALRIVAREMDIGLEHDDE